MILANLVGENWCYIIALVWISFIVSEAEHLKTLSFKQQNCSNVYCTHRAFSMVGIRTLDP